MYQISLPASLSSPFAIEIIGISIFKLSKTFFAELYCPLPPSIINLANLIRLEILNY